MGVAVVPRVPRRPRRQPRDIDLGAQVPARRAAPARDGRARRGPRAGHARRHRGDGRLASEAIEAGALGFTTSRTLNHRSSSGELTPSLNAEDDELVGIAEALGLDRPGRAPGRQRLQGRRRRVRPAPRDGRRARAGRSRSRVAQSPLAPDQWREMLDRMSEADAGRRRRSGPRCAARAVGLLLGLRGHAQPVHADAAVEGRARRPADAERVARLRRDRGPPDAARPARRGAKARHVVGGRLISRFELMFPLGDPPDYEPDPRTSIAAARRARGPVAGRGRLRRCCSAATAGRCSTCRR